MNQKEYEAWLVSQGEEPRSGCLMCANGRFATSGPTLEDPNAVAKVQCSIFGLVDERQRCEQFSFGAIQEITLEQAIKLSEGK